MGIWRIGVDELARSRFAVSALAETIAAMADLTRRAARPGQAVWFAEHASAYRSRVAEDAWASAFVQATVGSTWLADFMSRPPLAADRTFHDELRRVRETPYDVAAADLTVAVGGRLPAAVDVPDVADRVADLLEWTWTHAVRPDWPRRRRVFEADIVARTHALSSGGWAAALDGMRPGMRWLGDGRLQINPYDKPPRDLTGAELLFVPSTAVRGWVAWDEPDRYAVIYPCTGELAEVDDPSPSDALSRLLGLARAAVLTQLGTPCSTTQLVALTGYGLGSVGGHLKVLLDAKLVRRTRSGRSVLYYRTATGNALVRATGGGVGTSPAR